MAVVANRRSVMTLFSSPTSPLSHCARLVLAEKGITFDVVNMDSVERQADLAGLNPYGDVPTLVDRDLVLYDVRIISEYLDERFPHPPLMPVDPVSRASSRLGLYRVFNDWYSLLPAMEGDDKKAANEAKKQLREGIASTADIFELKPFFLSEEMSLVDCAIAPVLWRLEHYRIDLPRQAKSITAYADRMFARDAFQVSLTEEERDMRV